MVTCDDVSPWACPQAVSPCHVPERQVKARLSATEAQIDETSSCIHPLIRPTWSVLCRPSLLSERRNLS
ncbi:hypothetical protein RRG08_043181 [Elysia crispata]|uniref:Uncharacterized protein n=1 Tax=Elysia crispata TaxID=231223 RepID=A0AAE0ZIE8_9GAST|nr:hypothetical protein RRG08_043181 [Elysia crispata]